MKKILLTLLTIFMLVPMIGTFEAKEVKALGQNEMSCGAFEVDYINDDGSFTMVSCHDDFSSAKAKMKELGGDHVVRSSFSFSYTKIVAMNSGIAYAYNRSSNTIKIYQHPSIRGDVNYKSTYIANKYAMDYVDTERCFISSSNQALGMIEVNVMGFHGYADLESTDLVPSKFIRNGISITIGGSNGGASYNSETPYSIVCKQNYFEVVKTGNYRELVYHIYYGRIYNGQTASETLTLGVTSDSMVEGVKYYSYDGYNFYTNDTFTDNKITYYNYYQFLPLRSTTNVSADALNGFISSHSGSVMFNSGQYFIDAQNKYGINALLLFAMACHESAYGTSGYARNRNNLFGWNAVDADPDKASYFSSVADCVNEQAGINLRGFVDITDWRFFSSSLGNKGSGLNVQYASDPYWGMEIAALAYSIDKYANNKDGNLSDLNKYSLYLINTFDIPVKASADDNSATLYSTQYGLYYQENFIVISLGNSDNGYTKVQSTNPIDEDGNIKKHTLDDGNKAPISNGEYNFEKSVGYIKSSYLTYISGANNSTDIVETEKEIYSLVDSMSLTDDGYLNIKGAALIKGINNTNSMSHSITLKCMTDSSDYKTYDATTSQYIGVSFNDGLSYTNIGFEVNIPLNDLETGNYYLTVNVKNGNTTMSKSLSSYFDEHSNLSKIIDSITYHITTNSYYSYRIELDKDSLPSMIDYSKVNKPSIKNSLFSFDKFTLDENLSFYMYGQGFIYRTNFNNKDSVKYTLYLVDDASNYIEIAATTADPYLDYTKLFNSEYDMTNICFEASSNLANLNSGYYQMILKIQNGDYIDFVEMTNPANSKVPSSVTVNNKTYRFFTSTIRNRLMLEVK